MMVRCQALWRRDPEGEQGWSSGLVGGLEGAGQAGRPAWRSEASEVCLSGRERARWRGATGLPGEAR